MSNWPQKNNSLSLHLSCTEVWVKIMCESEYYRIFLRYVWFKSNVQWKRALCVYTFYVFGPYKQRFQTNVSRLFNQTESKFRIRQNEVYVGLPFHRRYNTSCCKLYIYFIIHWIIRTWQYTLCIAYLHTIVPTRTMKCIAIRTLYVTVIQIKYSEYFKSILYFSK